MSDKRKKSNKSSSFWINSGLTWLDTQLWAPSSKGPIHQMMWGDRGHQTAGGLLRLYNLVVAVQSSNSVIVSHYWLFLNYHIDLINEMFAYSWYFCKKNPDICDDFNCGVANNRRGAVGPGGGLCFECISSLFQICFYLFFFYQRRS